ncbi:MAG: DNA primase [Candidatus Pacebacteria bacterium]|nr:DNA primase [Candidatus Paceibacterota bacterium]
MSDVEEIKSRLSIDEVISQYLKFKKAGSSFIAICPFHNEKSPSFNISPSLGIYKCFGCGESGDIFSFVQKMEGITFPEALEKLASQAGVILTKKRDSSEKKKQAKEEKERLLKILEEATLFFQINLSENNQAENYLKKRGVNENIVRKFRLGFAKDSWHSLEEFLYSKNYKQEELIKIGLIKKNEKGKIYDRFRNRIIFPLFDLEDKPVAFSGRDLSGTKDIAKYLNSPETIFFNKSEVLYGLNFAKFEGRKRDYFIIVEGQMDLIMSHQIGFENTVAVSGTSLTTQHLKNLGRFSKNLIFAFDSDKAGIEAAFKGIKLALSENFDVKILDISRGMDPADVILENSKK